MGEERALEILNNIINQLSVAEKNDTIIKYLLHVGVTKQELVEVFGYYQDEVDQCDFELSNEGWEGGPVFG